MAPRLPQPLALLLLALLFHAPSSGSSLAAADSAAPGQGPLPAVDRPAAAAGPFAREVSGVRNVTVYRLTPSNYTGLINLNSGDASGDLGFGLWELLWPMDCKNKAQEVGCSRGTGRFIDAPGENLTYVKLTVEMNTLTTSYLPCNPDPITSEFKCEPDMPGGPGGNGTQCQCDGGRSSADCGCDTMRQRAVGRDKHGQHQSCLTIRSKEECGRDDTQCQCSWNTASGQCRPLRCEDHTSLSSCKAATCAQGRGQHPRVLCAWAINKKNQGHCRTLECEEVTDQVACENAQDSRNNQCSWSKNGFCTGKRQPDPCSATPSPCCDGLTNATE